VTFFIDLKIGENLEIGENEFVAKVQQSSPRTYFLQTSFDLEIGEASGELQRK